MTDDDKQKLSDEVQKAARDSAIASYAKEKLLKDHPDLSKEQKAALTNASNEYYKISQEKINSVKKTDRVFYDELRMLNAAEQGKVLIGFQADESKFANELSAINAKLSGVIGGTNKAVADANAYRPSLSLEVKPAPDIKPETQQPAIKLAPENTNSPLKEDGYTTQLKKALLRSAVASRVMDETIEKHPEILDVEPDKKLLLKTLGMNENAQVFNQIDTKLADGKLFTMAELLKRMEGTPEEIKRYSDESKKISPKEDFLKGSPEYLKEIYAQIDSGMHNAEINGLRKEVDKKIGAKYVGKLIDAARKELQEVAIGNAESDKLTKILGRLENNHDLGPEVLSSNYDYKNPVKRDETAEKMQKRVNYSIESGDALLKAHAALKGIRSGEIDVKDGINTINDQLSKYGFGYDKMDPYKTANEMKAEIKAAVTRGNFERVEHIKAGKNYNKPDYDLDIKEMLSVKEDKAKAGEVFSKVSGKVKERNPKVVPETVNVVVEQSNATVKPSAEPANKSSGETPAVSKENDLEKMLNRRKQELERESLPDKQKPDKKLVEHLKGKMQNDEIRVNAFNGLLQENPNLPHDKRRILDKLLVQDFDSKEIDKEKSIAANQGINEKDFFKAYFTAKAQIPSENKEAIKQLKEEARDEISGNMVGKHIKEVRGLLDKVASGDINSSYLLGRLKFHGLGIEVLDREYDHKHPEKPHKTAEEMENILTDVFEKGGVIYKEREAPRLRETLNQVASGIVKSSSLLNSLNEHGLGMETLDPQYDPKNPGKSTTAAEMEKKLTPLFAKADNLYEAREALRDMEAGKTYAKAGIDKINKHLSSAALGYDALDEKFDLRKPDAQHKTSKEIKEEIKSAAEKGYGVIEDQIKSAVKRNGELSKALAPSYLYEFVPTKPDRNLDLDKLLNLPEGKKTSSISADDKFAAIMEGVKVSPLIAYNQSNFVSGAPQNGRGGQALA